MEESVYIISACRTPVGNFGGSLRETPVVELGEIVIKEAIERANIKPTDIDEVIFGNVIQAGLGQNPARQSAVRAGIPFEKPSMTINQVCASGLKSINLACQSIKCNDSECVIAGGMENMSMAPFIINRHRWGKRMGNDEIIDEMIYAGLWDIFNDYHMGITAENIAKKFNISRKEQDEFAYRSHMKAVMSIRNNIFNEEIVKVRIQLKKEKQKFLLKDEHPRPDTSPGKLKKLKPAFLENGTVTAGNSSGINDGAAAVILVSEKFLKENNITPMAKIISYGTKGVDPAFMGLGPIPSTKIALKKANLKLSDIGLIELNEAFAAQSIAVSNQLNFNYRIVNVNGGAIALGHPIGASGARIFTTLLYEMLKRNIQYGLATMCVGGGMGESTIIENYSYK